MKEMQERQKKILEDEKKKFQICLEEKDKKMREMDERHKKQMEDWKNDHMVATKEPERNPDQAAADRNVKRKKRTQQPD